MPHDRLGFLDRVIEFFLYLTISVVPLVYFNNPIATEYFFSKSVFLDFLVYGGISLYFLRAVLRNELTFRWGITFLPMALFCLFALVSLGVAQNFWKGWETVVRVGASVPFLFLLYQEVGSRESIKRFLMVAALTNIGITVYGFLQFYEVFPLPKDQYGTADPSTTIGLTNFVMEYMTPFMFVMPIMIIVSKSRFAKSIFVTATMLQWYYFLISDNRAAQVGLAGALPLGTLLIVSQYRRGTFRFSKKALAMAAVAAVVVLGMFATSGQGHRFMERTRSIFSSHRDDAITFRLETWRQALKVFHDNPTVGVGLANLEVIFPLYQSSFLENMTLKKNTRVVRAHNDYVQVLADLGLAGGVVFLWFLIAIVRTCYRAYKQSVIWDDLLLATGLVLGVNAYLIVAFFAFPFEVPSSGLSIMFIVGLLAVMTRRVLTSPEPGVYRFPRNLVGPVAYTGLALSILFTVYTTVWMWHVLRGEVYFKESRVMKDLNQFDDAKSLLDDAIRFYPQNEAYYYDRSIFAIRDGDIPRALADLQKTAELVPNYAMGHKQMGLLAAQMGDYRRAAKEFEFAFRVYHDMVAEYMPLLVNAYIGYNDSAKAVELVKKYMGDKAPYREGVTPELLLTTGQAYLAAKDNESAEAALRQALQLRPSYAEAHAFLAACFIEMGKFSEALAELDEAQRAGLPGRQIAMAVQVNRIKAYLGLKKFNEAKSLAQAALATDPGIRGVMLQDKAIRATPEMQPLLAP